MRDRDEVKRMPVECLGRGESMLDKLLYAYQVLRGLDGGELLEMVEKCEEVEVIKRKYRPRGDGM